MVASRDERRLAAILVADIAGYTRLIEEDEAGTLQRWRATRQSSVEPLLAGHGGRLVKLTGDGFLAEFASVSDALGFALALQEAVAAQEAGLPADRRLRLRVGVHLGDVVIEGGDLYGDSVNIAARLEGLAEPGGLVVSGAAFDQLKGTLARRFTSLGEQHLKHIARPVRAYRLVGAGAVAPPPAPERPSLAVLPFADPSDDPERAYFGDGITEDLITELSRFRELRVLARDATSGARGQRSSADELGRRLGVQFVLEGSVRMAGGRVRITAQLVEAATGAHVWAERYDRELSDLFATQDEIVATIAATLSGRIQAVGVERARRKQPADLAAYDCLLRGIACLRGYAEGANSRAKAMFERATQLDPNYALGKAYLALTIYVEELHRGRSDELQHALKLAEEAVALDADDSRCHRILAEICLHARQFQRAGWHSERAVTLNPNDAHNAAFRAYVLMFIGEPEQAVDQLSSAIRRDPFHPEWFMNALGRALHFAGRHEEALAAYHRVEASRFFDLAYLAACCACLGRKDEAAAYVARTLAAKPGFSTKEWVATLPFRREADRERLHQELLAAGLPP